MNNVRAERLKREMSIGVFSIKTSVSEATLRRIEDPHDTSKVHIDTARQIASYLNVTVRSLFPNGEELTILGGSSTRITSSGPRNYPVCSNSNCRLEIPPAFKECPECN